MTQPHSEMVITPDFDSGDEGSNPSEAAINDEIRTYRAHRFAITKLEDGNFALFNPFGQHIATGTIESFAPLILSGMEHYETCADRWAARTRFESTTVGQSLLQSLGLAKPTIHPSVQGKIERRI